MRPAARAVILGVLLGAGAGAAPRTEAADPALGRRTYEENCAICHGLEGDGRGHAAQHFVSPPRDLTAGRFKLRSTGSGQLPTDDDLKRSIVRGLPGTGMVPQDHLSAAEIDAVVAYIKTLAPKFATAPQSPALPIPPAPPNSPEAVARGRKVYHKAECHECHGEQGRGDGPSAKDLKVKPVDLTRRPFKGGSTPEEVFRAIVTGYDGTPMPSYHLILDDAELWDLTYYVVSLGGPPETTDDERAGWHVVRHHQRRR
ncbi:MAG TPA: c-type cytochrome [Methylomirabilota bacterium]|nr:c-type cytochrome [Methylomirabilota bacterium]